MAIGSLRSVVNDSLIRRFQGIAQGSSSQSIAQTLRGGASTASISDGLRTGARTYSTAVQALNSISSLVNLSQSTLEQLGGITDKLIGLTEKATRTGLGTQGRSRLDRQFRELGKEFKTLVEKATAGEREYLTTDGLSELLNLVGLSPENATSVSKLFEQFIITPKTKALAAEEIKGRRPVPIPPGAFTVRGGAVGELTTFEAEQISLNTPLEGETNGFVSASHSIHIKRLSGGQKRLTIDPNGPDAPSTLTSTPFAVLNLLARDEASGYSLVEAQVDYLGFNTSNYNQLFLVDTSGQVVHQYTDNSSPTASYSLGDISADLKTAVFFLSEGDSHSVYTATADTLGEDPTLASSQLYTSFEGLVRDNQLQINDAGTHIAFRNTETNSIYFASAADPTNPDAFLDAQTENLKLGFVASTQLALGRDTDISGSADTIVTYTFGDGAFSEALASGLEVSGFATVEKGVQATGFLAYSSSAVAIQNDVAVYKSDGTFVQSYDAAGTDAVDQLSLAHNGNGSIDLGIFGVIEGINGQVDPELYRLAGTTTPTGGTRNLSRISKEAESIFDGTLRLTNRADAYRLLTDLKALKEQIQGNINSLDGLREVIQSNIDLTRAAGLGMLEIADQITSSDDAVKVAEKLREYIRRNAGAALTQAENLDPIAAAALLLKENGFDRLSI